MSQGVGVSGGVTSDGLSVPFSDYLRVLRTRSLTIVLVTLLVAGLATAAAATRPVRYVASATVLLRPMTADPLQGFEAASRLIDIVTERQVAQSATVAQAAVERLGTDMTPEQLVEGLTIETAETSQVLRFVHEAGDPQVAADRAMAFADAYLAFRADRATETLARARTALESRFGDVTTEMAAVEAQVAELAPDADGAAPTAEDAEALAELEARLDVLRTQRALLANELSQLSGAAVNPGEVISPAVPPRNPAGPGLPEAVIVGLAMGAVLGVAAAFARDRLDGIVRDPSEVQRLLASPVLGRLPDRRPRRRTCHLDMTRSSVALRRAAVAVAAARREGHPLTLIVAAAGPHVDAASAAVGIAQALATWEPTLVVDADATEATLTHLLGSGRSQGLADHTEDPESLVLLAPEDHRPDFLPAGHDHDLAPGDTAAVLQQLTVRYRYVVVAAPPTDQSATALELTEIADSVLLPVVRLGHTRAADLRAIRHDASTIGVTVIGSLLIGQFRHRRRTSAVSQVRATTRGRATRPVEDTAFSAGTGPGRQ